MKNATGHRSTRAHCSNCGHRFDPTFHPGWRVAAGAAGLLVGSLVTESFLGGLVIGGLSYAAARVADRHYALRCPECGARAAWEKEPTEERPPAAEETSAAA